MFGGGGASLAALAGSELWEWPGNGQLLSPALGVRRALSHCHSHKQEGWPADPE